MFIRKIMAGEEQVGSNYTLINEEAKAEIAKAYQLESQLDAIVRDNQDNKLRRIKQLILTAYPQKDGNLDQAIKKWIQALPWLSTVSL